MQLHLQLSGSLSLPLNYRHYIQSMIYDALRSDQDFSSALHDKGTEAEKRRFKLFTFGQLEGSYRIADRRILFSSGASLEIRSIHEDLLFRLFRCFTPGTTLRLGSATVIVEHADLTNTVIVEDTVTVRTCSPIVAYITRPDGHTRFFSPEEPEFYTLVTANARRKWSACCGEEGNFEFFISPAEGSRFRKQVTTYKSTRITAWDGQFILRGSPELLNLLYHTGLGAKSSQGFGMFFLAQKDPDKTVQKSIRSHQGASRAL